MSFYDDASLVFLPSGGAGKDGKAYSIKPVPEYGNELVTNGGFDTDSDWVKGAGWTISGGTANCDGSSNILRQSNAVPLNTKFYVFIEVSNYVSGTLQVKFAPIGYPLNVTKNGIYTISTNGDNSTNGDLQIISTSFIGSIDNVSVKEVIVDGDFTFSRGSNLTATRVDSNGLIEKGRENLLINSVWDGVTTDTKPTGWTSQFVSGTGTFDVTATEGQIRFQTLDASSRAFIYSPTIATNGIVAASVYVDEVTTAMPLSDLLSRSGSATFLFAYEDGVEISYSDNVQAGKRYSVVFNKTASTNFRFGVGASSGALGDVVLSRPQIEIGLVATEYIESGATTGKAGILEDSPRFDFSGGASCPSLLLEPSRTNLVIYSEYFSGLSLSGNPPIITQNYAVSPEGVQNAVRVQDTDATNFKIIQTQFSITAGSTYTISVYVKKATSPISTYGGFYFDFDGGTRKTSNLIFDEYNGTLVNATGNAITSVIHPVIDEGDYWRFSATATDTGSNNLLRPTLRAGASANGTSLSLVTKDYTAYGFQCEEGSYPTSYIPNHSGGSVTRSGEGQSSSDFSTELSTPLSNAYTLFLDFEVTNNEDTSLNFQDIFNFKFDESLSKDAVRIETYHIGGVDSIRVFVYKQSSGTQVTSVAPNVIPMGSRVKLACVLDDSYGVKIFYNGTKIIDHQEITAYEQTKFLKGSGINGNIRSKTLLNKILAFPTALSDADLATLTS